MSEPTQEEWAILLPAYRKLKAEWEAGRKPVVITSAQHEALMAAAYWLLKLRSLGYVSAGHGRAIADEALSIVRATGIEIKADRARDERMREIALRAAGIETEGRE